MESERNNPDLQRNKMRTKPVGRLLFTMALPLAVSMLVQALYNVVDTFYVSRISQSAVTALSLAFPVQNLLIGFATGVGVGMNALLSKSLGQGNRDRANRAAGNGIVLSILACVLFMLFGLFAAKPYFAMQSDVAQTVEGGAKYTAICCIFSLGVFVEILGERLLQASGRTVYTLFTQGIGAVLNIILDPLFIFGYAPLGIPAMGIAGAAVATVAGQWVAAVMAIIFNLTSNPDVQFGLQYLRLEKCIVKKILTVGIPSIIMMAIGSVMNFCMNQIFLSFRNLGETAAAVFGIYFKLQSFFFMPTFGINNASISVLAYNYGARQPKRIIKTLKFAVGYCLVIMLLGVAVFQIFPQDLMGIFNSSDGENSREFMQIGISALRIVSWHFPLVAVGVGLGGSFQALGVGIYSTITSLCRQLIVLVPAAWLLSLTGNVSAVWWSFPIAEVVSAAVSVICFIRIYRKKIKPML